VAESPQTGGNRGNGIAKKFQKVIKAESWLNPRPAGGVVQPAIATLVSAVQRRTFLFQYTECKSELIRLLRWQLDVEPVRVLVEGKCLI
jgi:hypothetical protein